MKAYEWIERIRKATSRFGFACDCCGTELFDYPQTRVCSTCESTFYRNNRWTCPACGRKTVTDGVCLVCKEHPPAFIGISPFVYLGDTASVLNRIKRGNRRLCYYYAEQTFRAFTPYLEREKDLLLLPVPMTEKRKRKRGYNQAEDLADALLDILTQAGVQANGYKDILIKQKETPQQKNLSLRDRRANMQGVFHLKHKAILKDKTVLLVDDIMTTGATGDVCARLCKGAGAKKVYFISVASLPERLP